MLAGQIGASGEGLRRWLDQAREGFWTGPLPEADEGILGHLRPDPPLWAGPRALGEGATAAIDLSDGLATDIENLARACGLRIDLDLEDLPVAECARALDDETLVSAGEDYALALLVPSELTKRFEGLGFVCVGRASTGEPGVHFLRDGHPLNLRTSPFEHFES
jgi:thiamine-monophosphate kinase